MKRKLLLIFAIFGLSYAVDFSPVKRALDSLVLELSSANQLRAGRNFMEPGKGMGSCGNDGGSCVVPPPPV